MFSLIKYTVLKYWITICSICIYRYLMHLFIINYFCNFPTSNIPKSVIFKCQFHTPFLSDLIPHLIFSQICR